ncbi:MAG: TRAP transporter substrate-binding protein DctP [Hyphomicrobiales bacterium]|nr:TRAP transporter substrate-binding protein DctP [Hyphomicrobiales bacterium]
MSALNRRKFIKGAAVAGAATTAVAAPAIAQSMPEIRWRQTASWPKSLDTLYGAAEVVGKRVAELTDNKFQIQTFAAGELVPALQVLDAVQNGQVECGHTALYYYFGKDDTFVFGSALPFGMNMRIQNAWLQHGGGQDLLNEFLKGYNCYFMPAGNTNCQMGGWFRKEISKPDDLKGLKFRLGGFAGKIMQRVGVVPQQIGGGDIYPALEKGTIDGAEWVGPYDDEKLGFYKVAKIYHYPGWWEPSSTGGFICNTAKWNELPKLYKEALTSACAEANNWTPAKYDAVNPGALKRLVAGGATLRPFSPEVMDHCYQAAQGLYKELAEKNAAFKKIYDSYAAWMADGYLWHQVADFTMDSYMIRYRNMRT